MTIKASLLDYLGDSAEGDTIAKVLGGSGTIAEAIDGLEAGEDGITPTGNKAITSNGTAIDVTEYATVSVTVPAYVISFDANGGTGTVDPVACAAGSTAQLPAGTGLTAPEGKLFSGWGATDAATEGVTEYAATADATLYAVWADEV